MEKDMRRDVRRGFGPQPLRKFLNLGYGIWNRRIGERIHARPVMRPQEQQRVRGKGLAQIREALKLRDGFDLLPVLGFPGCRVEVPVIFRTLPVRVFDPKGIIRIPEQTRGPPTRRSSRLGNGLSDGNGGRNAEGALIVARRLRDFSEKFQLLLRQ